MFREYFENVPPFPSWQIPDLVFVTPLLQTVLLDRNRLSSEAPPCPVGIVTGGGSGHEPSATGVVPWLQWQSNFLSRANYFKRSAL